MTAGPPDRNLTADRPPTDRRTDRRLTAEPTADRPPDRDSPDRDGLPIDCRID
jgi:hypothetical protein